MKRLIILATLLLSVGVAKAQSSTPTLLVAAASSSGTYDQMLKQIMTYCNGPDLQISEAPISGGATNNLQALMDNDVSAAFMHSDVIIAKSWANPDIHELKTLVALFPEEIHVLALKDSHLKTKGKYGTSYGSQDIIFNTLADLAGYTVGAAGGGAITASVLKGTGEVPFKVQTFDTGGEVIPALDNGTIQAAIFVGGAPLKNIKQLDGNRYKLLSIPESVSSKLKNVYQSATIDYANLHSGPIQTLAPLAIIATRAYTRERMVTPQRLFRQCFMDHLDDLKETPGMHPKWRKVSASNHGVWEYYNIPGEQTAAQSDAGVSSPKKVAKKRHQAVE
jgi:TRAP-type uncharacterized transport system substrate-binding protein